MTDWQRGRPCGRRCLLSASANRSGSSSPCPSPSRGPLKNSQREVAEIVCVQTPDDFEGVGQWYEDFTQTSDEEVRALLAAAKSSPATRAGFVSFARMKRSNETPRNGASPLRMIPAGL